MSKTITVRLTEAQAEAAILSLGYKLEVSPDGDGDGPKDGSAEAKVYERARDAIVAALASARKVRP